METITLLKKEYQELLEKAFRYQYLKKIIEEKQDIFSSPPNQNIKEIIEDFQRTKLYSSKFLKSLEKGLKRSSYFQT
ncbi:hypothetical protein KKA09_00905 [Patescibacteria group bacterium]|nr:hypothetical protein [Patescibacteria group bacterium]